jgi:hypothetical protein
MSSNVSSVLKRTADTCESKELTDKQLLLKAVVDIAKTTLYPKVQLWEKPLKCVIYKNNKVIGHHNTFVIDDTMISTNIGFILRR